MRTKLVAIIISISLFFIYYGMSISADTGVTVSNVKFYRGDCIPANEILYIEFGDIKGSAIIQNNGPEIEFVLVMALYKGNFLQELVLVQEIIDTNETKNIQTAEAVKLLMLDNNNLVDYSIKIIVLDSLTNGKPLAKATLLSDISSFRPPENQEAKYNYSITGDSFIKNGTDINNNFGTNSTILLKDVDNSYGVDRKGYLKVGFSDYRNETLKNSKIFFYATVIEQSMEVTLYGFTNDNWSESSITWNSPPIETGIVDLETITVTTPGWYCFDVTEFVKSQLVDKIASFKLTNQYGKGSVTFVSKDGMQNRPYMEITAIVAQNFVATQQVLEGNKYINVDVSEFKNEISSARLYFYCCSDAVGTSVWIYSTDVLIKEVSIQKEGWYSVNVTDYMPSTILAFKVIGNVNEQLLRVTTNVTMNIDFVDDTYIEDISGKLSTNYGDSDTLNIKTYTGLNRITYIKSDFSRFPGNVIQSAKLKFYVKNAQVDGLILAYAFQDDNWNENTVTWNNRPNDIDLAPIDSVYVKGGSTGWYEIDVTSYINTQITDRIASFKLTTQNLCGVYSISSSESNDNKPYLEISGSMAGISSGRVEHFVDSIGINTHLPFQGSVYDTKYSTVIKPKLSELGIKHIRDWSMKTSNTSTYSNTVFSRMKELYNLYGISFTVIGKILNNQTDYLDIAYDGAGETWEAVTGLNEPDHEIGGGDWPSTTSAHMQKVWNWARTNHTDVSVVGPVPANWSNFSEIGDLRGYMDYGDVHSYSGDYPVTKNIMSGESSRLHTASLEFSKLTRGNKPVIISETGWHTTTTVSSSSLNQPVTQTVMAKYILRSLFYNYNLGVHRTFLYELIDEGVSQTDVQNNYGLLYYNGQEKKSFTVLKNLLSILSDNSDNFTPVPLDIEFGGNTADLMYTLLQKTDGKHYLAVWLEKPGKSTDVNISQSITLKFNSDIISTVKAYSLNNIIVPSSTYSRQQMLSIDVTDDILLLEIY